MSSEADVVRRNRALQRSLYGEPLGDRMRRLLCSLGVSQARLAEALGISPAGLSQLISGRRAKIGTPDVMGRLLMLERGTAVPGVGAGDPRAVTTLLETVREARPLPGAEVPADESAVGALRAVVAADELARAATLLAGSAPSLAAVLRRAAELPS